MAIQVQIRRDTNTNLLAATPATGELGYNTTKKRIIAGDGSALGGIPHVNYLDLRSGELDAVTLTESSANVYAGAMTPPVTSYGAGGMYIRAKFPTENTGSVTVN